MFVGKSKRQAHDLAEFNHLIFRLVSVDGQSYLGYPEDQREDRICVELINGVVAKASVQ